MKASGCRYAISHTDSPIQSGLRMAAILFVAVVGVVLLVLQPFPVLHDYPEWMYQGYIVWSLLSDISPFAEHFALAPVPVPNSISQVAIALLNVVVSPVMAGKIWLAIYLLLAVVVTVIGTRHHQLRGAIQLIFLITIVFGPGFFNGYLNFQFGVLFFALFVVTDSRPESRPGIVRLLLFSLLIYFSHASVFAGFVLYVVATEIFNQRRMSVFIALVPSLMLLLWYSTLKLLADEEFNISIDSLMQWVQYKAYTLAKQGPFHNFILPDGQSLLSDLHIIYLIGFALNFVVLLLIGCWFLSIGWALLRRRIIAVDVDFRTGALVTTVVTLIVIWLIAGSNSFGVVNLGERFLIVALMLLLLQVRMHRWLASAWAILATIFGAVTLMSLLILSQTADSYAVNRSADATELTSFVDDIYSNSRHKYFNHRIFIYANIGQYLIDPDQYDRPLRFDHESSVVRILHGK